MPQDAKEARSGKEYLPLCEQWRKEVEKIIDLSHEKDTLVAGGAKADDAKVVALDEQAMQQAGAVRQAMVASDGKLNAITAYNVKCADAALKQAAADASSALAWTLAVIVGGVMSWCAWGCSSPGMSP